MVVAMFRRWRMTGIVAAATQAVKCNSPQSLPPHLSEVVRARGPRGSVGELLWRHDDKSVTRVEVADSEAAPTPKLARQSSSVSIP